MAWKKLVVSCAFLLAACGDNNRPVLCGNGRLDPPESCDPRISAGAVGFCPAAATDCNDDNVCTDDAMTGASTDCSAICTHTAVATCGTAPCGNGMVDTG